MSVPDAGAGPVSAFFTEQAEAWGRTSARGLALDLACGRGRHALAAAAAGLDVLAVDRRAKVLGELSAEAAAGAAHPGRVRCAVLDLEGAERPALRGTELFSCVFVFRYLHRPLMPWIEDVLQPGGLLIYETFTTAQRRLGWGPSRDAFLLAPGELPLLFPRLEIECYVEGPSGDPKNPETGRLVARRPL